MSRRFLNKLMDCRRQRHGAAIAWLAVGVGLLSAVASCTEAPRNRAVDATDAGATDSAGIARQHTADSTAAMSAAHDTRGRTPLSAAADSLAPYLVFAPAESRLFVAAVRNATWLLDVGRIDVDVRKDSARLRAFHEAAAALNPVPRRAVFRLHWAQGAEDVVVDSLAVYNGRLVMRLFGSAALDSAARGRGSLAALAVRADRAIAPEPPRCALRLPVDSAARAAFDTLPLAVRRAERAARRAADSAFDARVAFVRDSLDAVLRLERPPYERLQRRLKLVTSQARGCFGDARRALVVSLRAGDAEWVRERVVLIAPEGAVTALRVEDGRFRAHDVLTAFDADGDGVDDLAVRGTTTRAGGTALLRVDLVGRRAERLAAGFAWEAF